VSDADKITRILDTLKFGKDAIESAEKIMRWRKEGSMCFDNIAYEFSDNGIPIVRLLLNLRDIATRD